MSHWPGLVAYRRAVAVLAGLYFTRLAYETAAFHSNGGLLEHGWAEANYPYLWQPLFRPGQSDLWMQSILGVAGALSVGLGLGLYPRLCAAILYLVLACSYRWNFLVATVDDELMHLSLFWLLILLHHPQGPARRLFAVNFSLIYLVAGLSKWTSPMWRSGEALSAIAQLPGSRLPECLACLKLQPLNLLVMIVEPLFALLPWLAAGRPRRLLLAAWLAFHLLLVVTFDVAIANLCCLAAGLVIFERPSDGRWTLPDRLAALVLSLLIVSQLGSLLQPSWRSGTTLAGEEGVGLQRASNGLLWSLGLAQQYRLLDWIDERNYRADLYQNNPDPTNLRLGLALSYLTPAPWLRPPPDQLDPLREASWNRWQRWCGGPIRLHWRRL